ncbi:MAG TPA: hypothetical protein PLC17_14280 [Tenuifilaceae bacterium]|nr:hypothetical protein [Tenuifilaceae bacterium]HQB79577.1 hypothetical protein [Tenuifilaceae bacterium]
MKRIVFFLVACVSAAVLMTSCEKEDEFFDEAFLIGEWKGIEVFSGDVNNPNHVVHYKYFSDYTGYTWDVTDDMVEEDALPFRWTLVKSELSQFHIMVSGPEIAKYYTVTELTASTLKYKDDFGVSYSFTKVTK